MKLVSLSILPFRLIQKLCCISSCFVFFNSLGRIHCIMHIRVASSLGQFINKAFINEPVLTSTKVVRSRIGKSRGRMCLSLQETENVFPSGCISFQFHQQCMRVTFVSPLLQYLVLLICF